MDQIVIFIIGLVLGAVVIFFIFRNGNKKASGLIEKQAKEKEEHLQKIKNFIANKDRVTNDEIEKLLGVSDSTAERYLEKLVEDGIIKKAGSEGHTFYTK